MSSSKNNRFYLDYNATAPLCLSFRSALASGEIIDGNASSAHSTGKAVAKEISIVENFLFNHFNLDPSKFKLFFHSGATEAANTFFELSQDDTLAVFSTDHSCIKAQKSRLVKNNTNYLELPVESDGSINVDEVIAILKNEKEKCQNLSLHFTQMNNETGSVLKLSDAVRIKQEVDCKVYVDSVQAPGKVSEYMQLEHELDVYTYSGHKFGALKGIGFSFVKNDFEFAPLILGGGQQRSMRSGTINSQGIASLKYALEELVQNESKQTELVRFKESIIELLANNLNLIVIPNESFNTITFIHKKLRADVMLIHFDLAGLDVSSGSACSSGSIEPSDVINALGYSDLASNSIRISLGFNNLKDSREIIERISKVLLKL